MAISYKNLWKLLIDRDMKKKDLQQLAGISAASITKLGKNENVNTEIIAKICTALKCDVSDIMEVIPDTEDCYYSQPMKEKEEL
ncbi:MAG: helix-turn-helix transcriptional regulator [Lachnospiraceae bacterium]|nr:helix-turn-helix transcriptional regulator [Lachnospiraceae bacterium]